MSPRETQTVNEEKTPKNKPKASKLRQQKLPAWQPILTASTVIPSVVAVGIIFIPIGIALFLASDSVKEYKVDYTNCNPSLQLPNVCTLTMDVLEDMEGDVYIYYYLENFYQNHRRYVKSRNDKQYLGHVNEVSDCDPFDFVTVNGQKTPIAPCGAIANSMFNDTFEIRFQGLPVPVTTEGVLWDIDKNKKFKNPPTSDSSPDALCQAFQGTARPPYWQEDPCKMGGFENVDFIVWMRTAALPNFRKLWRIVNRNADQRFSNGLPKGSYQITVNNRYPVEPFGGRKAIVFSTTSWAGGKNSFLGIAYLVVGCLAIVLAVIFIIIHIKFGHSVAELSNISPTGN